jgi:hypothetical protein
MPIAAVADHAGPRPRPLPASVSHLPPEDVPMTRVSVCLALIVSIAFAEVAVRAAAPQPKVGASKSAPAAAPLHEQIDRLFEADTLVPTTPQSDDAEFLRRAMLDLHGIIPTAADVRSFLADKSPTKRTKLIDDLLASPRFARHMATTFDVLWLERKVDKNIKVQDWYDYLYHSFHEGKPYDQLVREILLADDLQEATKPATKFYHVRACEPNALTRDIGRLFFGMDMQCNQCHDHPTIDDYTIADYYGLYAFVNRTYLFTNKQKVQFVAEKPDGEASFKSVFTDESADKVVPRVPRGPAIVEPVLKKGEEYAVKPDKAKEVKPIPAFSRRAALAERGVDGSSEMFDRNAANRLWAQLIGRGLVHPVDFHHPYNPPSHPALLDLLAREFRTHGCDPRYLLREIALSKFYGRSCELPRPQQLSSPAVAKRKASLERELAEVEKQLKAADDEYVVRRLKTLASAKRNSLEEARLAAEYLDLAAAKTKSNPVQTAACWDELVRFWENRGDVPLLKPLSPESFTLSLMQATGAVDSVQRSIRTAFVSKKPKEWTDAEPSQRPKVEAMLVEKMTYSQFKNDLQKFVGMYGDVPGADFGATVNQALFFGNAGVVDALLKPTPGNLIERLVKAKDSQSTAEELYLTVLGRKPTPDDAAAVAAFLKGRTDREVALQEMTWGLMSSNEFRFNH